MAVSANRWHPLAFDARSYGLRRTVARSLFSHMSGALPPPRLLGAIDTCSPTTHPPTHRRSFLFHFLPHCFDHGLLQSTHDRRRTHRAPSPAPSAVHQQLQVYAQGAVTGAVGSAPAIAGVGRHRRRQESLPRHTVRESARSVADCRPTFDTCQSSEGWMWLL